MCLSHRTANLLYFLLSSECFVSPHKFLCWNPNAWGDGPSSWGFGRWLGHQGATLMNGFRALKRRLQRDTQPLPPCENIIRLWPTRGLAPHHAGNPFSDFNCPEMWDTHTFVFISTYSVVFCYCSTKGLICFLYYAMYNAVLSFKN